MNKNAIRLDLYKLILMDAPEVPESIKTNILPSADQETMDYVTLKYKVPVHERIDEPIYKEKEGLPELRKQIIKDVERRDIAKNLISKLTQKKYIEFQTLRKLVNEATLKKDSSYLRALFSNIQNLLAPWLWNTKIGEALRLIQSALDEADRIESEKSRMWSLTVVERNKILKQHPEWFK